VDISSFCALALQYANENLSDGQFFNSLLKKQTYIQLQREREGGLCSKFRTVYTEVDPCRGEIKKRVMTLGRISFDEVEKSQTKCSLDIPRQTTT
jgi:hypothetical protein